METTATAIVTANANDEIRELQAKLKTYTTKWASMVVAEMSKVEPTDKTKLYGITSGGIKDRMWRVLFINAANAVIQRLESQYQAA